MPGVGESRPRVVSYLNPQTSEFTFPPPSPYARHARASPG
jgi:hypothetical protein